MKAALTSKGQITIPKPIRDRMGLKPGDILEFDENVTYLKARRAFDEKRMRSVVGRGGHEKIASTQEMLDEMRGPVELP